MRWPHGAGSYRSIVNSPVYRRGAVRFWCDNRCTPLSNRPQSDL